MNVKFYKQETLFLRLLAVILLIALVPLVLFGFNLLRFHGHAALFSSAIIFYVLVAMTIFFAILGSRHLWRRINEPLTQLTKGATEIARGNFSHMIDVNTSDEVGRLGKIFNYMNKELRRLNEMNLNEIISEKNKTKTIIRNIADGVIVTDPENKILMINSVAEQWFELNEMDVINSPLEQFIDNRELMVLIEKARTDGNQHDHTVELQLRSGKSRKKVVLQAKAAEVISKDGTMIGAVTIFRDITREKEIDKLKTELVSMVAHELRSPLTSIAGFSELLLDNSITQEQSKEYADIILKESNRLGNLINKFLDISRIEAGKSQVNKMVLDIQFIIKNILELNMYQAEKKGIRVNLSIPDELPPVNVDKGMIEEVVLNLFSNAVKYSPENTQIDISAEPREHEMLIAITDQGFGISKESLPNIFNKFYRVTDNEKVKDIEGSGLGLSLVKEIIELHAGTIWAESELEKGSTFYFTLPINDTQADPLSVEETERDYII